MVRTVLTTKIADVRAGGGLRARAAPTQESGLPSRVAGSPAVRTRPSAEKPAEAAAKTGVSSRPAEGKEGQGEEGGPGPGRGEEAGGQEGGQPPVREEAQEFWHW